MTATGNTTGSPKPTAPVTEKDQASPKPSAKPKPKKTPEQKREAKQRKEAAKKREAAKGEVKYTVSQTNGQDLHLCGDGEWRTNEDLLALAEDGK